MWLAILGSIVLTVMLLSRSVEQHTARNLKFYGGILLAIVAPLVFAGLLMPKS